MNVVIAICTYKRPEQLASLLHSLPDLDTGAALATLQVVVADNSPAQEGIRCIDSAFEHYPLPLHTVDASARAGISENRNQALNKALSLNPDVIACLDDDERPAPLWLVELLRIHQQTGAAVVGGPTRPEFPESATDAQRRNPYFGADLGLSDGAPCQLNAAGNFLITAAALQGRGPAFFDLRYGHSGGEDLAFFEALAQDGIAMAWASGAIVYEPVSPDRLTPQWMRQRVINIHNARVRIMQELQPGVGAALLRGLKTTGLGMVATVLSVAGLVHPVLAQQGRLQRWKFLGKLSAHLGQSTTREGSA